MKMEEDSVTECDIKTEILPFPTCSVFVKEEDVKTEILELEGIFFSRIYIIKIKEFSLRHTLLSLYLCNQMSYNEFC